MKFPMRDDAFVTSADADLHHNSGGDADVSSYNLLVLSDVHLGSDLVHCARPDAPLNDGDKDGRDQELAALFDWYRENLHEGRAWRLVIAGDFVDFVGMSVSPPKTGIRMPVDAEDLVLGLGGAEDHTIYKLRCVARRHRAVFESLARFCAAGNHIVVVRGNHDVDFHWPAVQDEFVRQLAMHARIERGSIEFSPWFYYEEGRVFVEHGHQYDRYCSYEHVLNPLSPRDPRRSSRSMSDILLRHVVRPTRGLLESGHSDATLVGYVSFGFGLGVRGTVSLFTRFALAVARLYKMWHEHFSESAQRIRQHHERRMADLAARLDLKLESLRALASLQQPPVTRSFGHLALGVMLDRVLFSLLGVFGAIVLIIAMPGWRHAVVGIALMTVVFAVVQSLLSRLRPIDPTSELRERAMRVARLFPAAFVVMGHTHFPEVSKDGRGESTYVNLGAWAEEEGASGQPAIPASRTHLVVHFQEDGRSEAELRVWDSSTGPRRFLAAKERAAA
jgi:UDP-2,3-diacylglucosamine pyrophosphatase LpxH